jgi:hypothetical protein
MVLGAATIVAQLVPEPGFARNQIHAFPKCFCLAL